MRLKTLGILILTSFASGCSREVTGSLEAYCDGTENSSTELAMALGVDGGPRSIETGVLFIMQRDAVCPR